MDLLEPRLRDVGVDLGGGEILVTEEFLDDAQVSSPLDKVGGVGMAKGVGVYVTSRYPVIEDPADVARA